MRVDVSPDLISRVTDAVLDKCREWQNRPLDAIYPVIFFDALRVKIRDESVVATRRSISPWRSIARARSTFSACGSNRAKAPSSGCA